MNVSKLTSELTICLSIETWRPRWKGTWHQPAIGNNCKECTVVKRCVLEKKLLHVSTAYRKSYMRNQLVPKRMTLTFVWRLYQGHVNHCVTFDVEYLGNRYQMWRHVTTRGQTRDPNTLRALYF